MSEKYYQILEINKNATPEEIVKAYKKMALKYHPDRNHGNEEWAKQEFIKVGEAYSVLSGKQESGSSNRFSSDAKFKEFEEMFNEVKREFKETEREFKETKREFYEYKENKKQEDKAARSKAIRDIEEALTLSNVSISELDSSLWSPYSDWKEKVENSVGSDIDVFSGDVRIDINRAKRAKINNSSSGQGNYSRGDYSWKDSQQPKENPGKDWTGSSGDDNFRDREKNGKGGQNYDKKYNIKEIKDKIEFYKERLLKTSDEKEKQKYQEMMNNLEKELATLRNQSNNQDQDTPKKTEPSPEQINTAKDKLNEAINSNDKDKIANILNETNETAKASSDPDLKKSKEQAEDKLGEVDPEELRKIIKAEVAKELLKSRIKVDDLSPENKKRLDELNNNNVEPAKVKEIRTEVLSEAAIKALDKLIIKVKQAIKAGDKKKIANKVKELQQFIGDSSNEYSQSAYSKKKDIVHSLLEKAKNQSGQQKHNKGDNFFRSNNPVMWFSGVAIIGLVAGITLIIVRSRQKKLAIK